jgi:hypothetical protein
MNQHSTSDKTPKTRRGRETREKLLQAAEVEFGERLVMHMRELTRQWIAERVADAPDRLTAERRGIEAFIEFVRSHRNLYRVVSMAQFVAEDAFRDYYTVFAKAYGENLERAASDKEIRDGDCEVWTWALIGMTVFLGMRFSDWDEQRSAEDIATAASDLISRGMARPE